MLPLSRLLIPFFLCLPGWAVSAPTILIYGDSLSAAYGIPREQGWAHLLQQRLTQAGYRHQVANASISGETTRGGLTRVEQTLTLHRPSLVILELGANDGLRGLPIEEMRRNLAGIIAACKRHQARVLLVGMRIPPNYGPRYTREFVDSYALLAKQHNLPLIAFMLDGVAGKRELIQEDGLHPTAAAQPALLDNLWPRLMPLLGKQ